MIDYEVTFRAAYDVRADRRLFILRVRRDAESKTIAFEEHEAARCPWLVERGASQIADRRMVGAFLDFIKEHYLRLEGKS